MKPARNRFGLCVLALTLFAINLGAQMKEKDTASTRKVVVERFSVISSKPFDDVVAGIERGVAHPDMPALLRSISAAKNEAELEEVVNDAAGPTGIMQFNRFDLGDVLRKEQGDKARPIIRLLVGNPLIMKSMVKYAPDAGSYAPVTILIDQRADGVHVSYDKMASFLASYGSEEALKVARGLDQKIETLIRSAAL